MTPAGSRIKGGWHTLKKAKSIIYQPSTKLTKSDTTEPAPTLAPLEDYTSEWPTGVTPWLKIFAGLGIFATLAAIATILIYKCRDKKSKYVVSIKRKSLDHEANDTYLSPRMLNDDFEDFDDFDSNDITVQEMNYGNLDPDGIQMRPLPDIPVTPTGVVYEEMDLVSISASDQENNYDHLILPDPPTTPTSDAE